MKNFISILLLYIAFTACNKTSNNRTDTEMPKPTTTGANVLACKVDGVVHVYRGTPNMFNSEVGVQYIGPTGYKQLSRIGIDIIASDPIKYKDEVILFILYPDNITYPKLNQKYVLTNIYVPASEYTLNGGTFFVDTTNSYVIFTRSDSLVVSGSFEFHGVRKDSTRISLTEGLFDIARSK